MSSSLRVIAKSFNFKRATSNKSDDDRMVQSNISDELANHSVPYSSIPESSPSDMPQTDHFKFSTPDTTMDDHILGQLGHPTAPSGSTTGPPKTTIRLVSASNSNPTLSPELGTPQLRPVDPPFDILMCSPNAQGQSHVPKWPLSPQPAPSEKRLYPVLPADELHEAKQRQAKSRLPSQAPVSSSDNVQDLFSPAPKLSGKGKERVGIPRSEPFLFGSPLPRHSVSNREFDTAAASVLEEMNKRLSAAGVQKVGTDVFGTIPVATAGTNRDSGSLRAPDRFDRLHEEQFNKMDSIANHYAARRGAPGSKKRKSDVLGHGPPPARKRSSADTHVVGTASRKRMGIPGGFDDEDDVMDDVQEEGDRRMSKRVRVLEEDGGKDKGRRLTISPRKTEAEEKQAVRERAATRKMLEMRKEKRRSSRHARMSVAGPQAASSTFLLLFPLFLASVTGSTCADKGKATPRFGILSSAKSIVRSVWNFGVGSPSKTSRTGTAAIEEAAAQSKTASGAAEPKETKPAPPPKKPSLPAASGLSGSLASRKSIAPARAGISASSRALGDGVPKGTLGRASQVRQPSLRISSGATKALNPAPAGSISSRQSVRAGSVNARPSAGIKDSVGASHPSTSTGRAPRDEGTNAKSNSTNKASIFSPTRATSRLFAPTASSLAKMRSPGALALGPAAPAKSKTSIIVAQRAKTPPRNAVLDAITNSPGSPRGDKIFTTPLLLSPNRPVIPPPTKPTSLAAAATALAAGTRSGTQNPERPPATSSSAIPPALRAGRAPTSTTTKGPQLRKPRISRSRVIAKLGTQRAAAATTSSSSTLPSSLRATAVATASSKIPRASGGAARAPRVRSSMATATRRSYAGTKSAGRGSDVLMSAKKHVRQSEFVRRRSRMTGSTIGAGVGGLHGGSHAVDGDPDGSLAMDVDED